MDAREECSRDTVRAGRYCDLSSTTASRGGLKGLCRRDSMIEWSFCPERVERGSDTSPLVGVVQRQRVRKQLLLRI